MLFRSILEDYGKGVISQPVVDLVVQIAARRKIPVGLDPTERNSISLSDITVATPNRKEAFALAGQTDPGHKDNPLKDPPLRQVGEILMDKWGLQHLAITLGPHGMYLMSRGRPPRHAPTRAREVFDVSGAGDTVIATCTLALAAGATFMESVKLANIAAGVVIGKIGTASCTPDELLAHMRTPRK